MRDRFKLKDPPKKKDDIFLYSRAGKWTSSQYLAFSSPKEVVKLEEQEDFYDYNSDESANSIDIKLKKAGLLNQVQSFCKLFIYFYVGKTEEKYN